MASRNNFMPVMAAARADRLGVKRAEMEAFCPATAFADLPEERLATIRERTTPATWRSTPPRPRRAATSGTGGRAGAPLDMVMMESYRRRFHPQGRGYTRLEVTHTAAERSKKASLQMPVTSYWW